MQKAKSFQILMISACLLLAAFMSAKAHAEDRFDVISKLKSWQTQTSQRADLEPREKDQRVHFISRLIFQTERKYKEESLKTFISKTLKDMIETDQAAINQSFGNQEEFLTSLKESFDTLLEKNEDPLNFLQIFMEFSGITEPATVDEFAETRSYFDGRQVLAAREVTIEEAAAYLEEKEKALSPSEREWFGFKTNLVEEFTPIPATEPTDPPQVQLF